jgi:hypothetical protein
MYWLLALLDEISLNNVEIEFRTLICKMVVKAWYPLLKYKLSFGLCDNLANKLVILKSQKIIMKKLKDYMNLERI